MLSFIFLSFLFVSSRAGALDNTGTDPLTTNERNKLNELALDYHNYMRGKSAVGVVTGFNGVSMPKGSNIVNLLWDDGLATVAQNHANNCVYLHNADRSDQAYTARANMAFVMDTTTQYVGENMGYSTNDNATEVMMDGLMAMWREAEFYEFDNDVCNQQPCGHYTQMAWATSRYIGCGVALCPQLDRDGDGVGSGDGEAMFFVCNYWPGGNMVDNPIYDSDTDDYPCENCPWDHANCNYEGSSPYSYDPDWKAMPADIYSEAGALDGLCIGCGNPYSGICSTGRDTYDNCEYLITSGGCSSQVTDSSQCDTSADADNGFADSGTCTVADRCRYWCGTCHCDIPADKATAYVKFNECSGSGDAACDDGLGTGRFITGGCSYVDNPNDDDAEAEEYWEDFCENVVIEGNDGGNSGTDTKKEVSLCFAEDQYVLTYPNYERKQLSELELFDKILIFDELKDDYVWDDLMVKLHFNEAEFLNDKLIPMVEFVLANNETLTMTGNHLLFVNEEGLKRADTVQIGDQLKQFECDNVDVIAINNVFKYPRNLISYNGNLVINGIAISTFTDSIFGESEYWGKSIRFIMKHFYECNVWRYPAFYVAKMWNEYLSFDARESVLQFYFSDNKDDKGSSWFSSFVFTS